jgi:hypothetical protein
MHRLPDAALVPLLYLSGQGHPILAKHGAENEQSPIENGL